MDTPQSIWIQFAVTTIVVSVIFYLLREFKKFIRERDTSWQAFIKEMRDSGDKTVSKLAEEIRSLANELIALRKDFDVAVATMRERTSKDKN